MMRARRLLDHEARESERNGSEARSDVRQMFGRQGSCTTPCDPGLRRETASYRVMRVEEGHLGRVTIYPPSEKSAQNLFLAVVFRSSCSSQKPPAFGMFLSPLLPPHRSGFTLTKVHPSF